MKVASASFKFLRWAAYQKRAADRGHRHGYTKTYLKRCALGLELHKAEIKLVPLADASGFPLWCCGGLHTTSRMSDIIVKLPLPQNPRVTNLFLILILGESTNYR
jgi:hypothetical protein